MRNKGIYALLLTLILGMVIVASASAEGGQVHYVRPGETLSSIAEQYGVSPQAVMQANGLSNPDFVYVGQKLVIPSTQTGSGYNYYIVTEGDTLGIIALRLNTTPQALASANNLGDADMIYVGQKLNVPSQADYHAPVPVTCGGHHIVNWGDTLSSVAWRYGTTVAVVQQLNGLSGDYIYEGQRLCVPNGPSRTGQAGSRPHPDRSGGHHIVQAGETVSAIAVRYGLSIRAIIRANNLSRDGVIYAGQKLIIPDRWAKPEGQKQKPKASPTPVGPGYTDQVDVNYDSSCSSPVDVWVNQDQVTVEAKHTWCYRFGMTGDPEGFTAILVRTTGQTGRVVKVQRGNEAPTDMMTGYSPGFDSDYVWFPIAPGYYRIWVEGDESSDVVEFDLPSGQRAWVDFYLTSASESPRPRANSGWSGSVARNDSQISPQQGVSSVIIVRGPAQGLPIRIKAEGEFSAMCHTGQKPEYGPGACEFGGLWPGKYTLILEGSGAAVEVYVDGVATAEVTFDRQ